MLGRDVRSRVAIVTGAGSGIGRSVALELAQAGLHVVITDIDRRGAAATEAAVAGAGGSAESVAMDVTDDAMVEQVVSEAVARLGHLDVLVNNAGVFPGEAAVEDTDLAVWDQMVDVHLTGAFRCSRAVVPYLKRAGGGRIVNVASRAWLGSPRLAAYAASKGGLISLTRSLAIELGPSGITVNAVSPTAIETPMHFALSSAEQQEVVTRIETQPIPRLGRPEEVAFAVAFFVAEQAAYITGQHLYVGGGTELRSSSVT